MKHLIILGAALASVGAHAATITIDFDTVPYSSAPLPGPGGLVEVVSEGYSFVGRGGVSDVLDPGGNNVFFSFSVGIDFDTGDIFLSRQDGEAFALYSADFTNVSSFTVQSANGNFDSLTGPGLDQLGTGAWLNISSVMFSGPMFAAFDPVAIDNVVVGAAVPIPAAVWLFGSALVGLGWLRRPRAA